MELVRSSLRGDAYAFSAMVDQMPLLRELYLLLANLRPGMVDLEDCEGLSSSRGRQKTIAERNPANHFSGIQQSLGRNELGNAYWRLGAEDPDGGLAEVQSEEVPLPRSLFSGTFCLGVLRPLRRIPLREGGGRECFVSV